MFEQVPFDQFLSWKNKYVLSPRPSSQPSPDEELAKRFVKRRQQAKAINFGLPSGLSAAGLSAYAKSSYGIDLGDEEAKAFRDDLINNIYPELSLYLQDVGMGVLADNLGCAESDVWRKFSFSCGPKLSSHQPRPSPHSLSPLVPLIRCRPSKKMSPVQRREKRGGVAGGVRNILRGKTTKKDGSEYKKQFVEKVSPSSSLPRPLSLRSGAGLRNWSSTQSSSN